MYRTNSQSALTWSKSHTFLARILQKSNISDIICKNLASISHLRKNLSDSCRSDIFYIFRRSLQDSCRSRHFFARFLDRSCKTMSENCKKLLIDRCAIAILHSSECLRIHGYYGKFGFGLFFKRYNEQKGVIGVILT